MKLFARWFFFFFEKWYFISIKIIKKEKITKQYNLGRLTNFQRKYRPNLQLNYETSIQEWSLQNQEKVQIWTNIRPILLKNPPSRYQWFRENTRYFVEKPTPPLRHRDSKDKRGETTRYLSSESLNLNDLIRESSNLDHI